MCNYVTNWFAFNTVFRFATGRISPINSRENSVDWQLYRWYFGPDKAA